MAFHDLVSARFLFVQDNVMNLSSESPIVAEKIPFEARLDCMIHSSGQTLDGRTFPFQPSTDLYFEAHKS